MAMNSTEPWVPPPESAVHVNNCTAASAIFASGVGYGETSDWGYEANFNFLRSLIPSNWTSPTDGQLLVWSESWDDSMSSRIAHEMLDMVRSKCNRQVCDYLQLEGDPDLAGIGVSDGNLSGVIWGDPHECSADLPY